MVYFYHVTGGKVEPCGPREATMVSVEDYSALLEKHQVLETGIKAILDDWDGSEVERDPSDMVNRIDELLKKVG